MYAKLCKIVLLHVYYKKSSVTEPFTIDIIKKNGELLGYSSNRKKFETQDSSSWPSSSSSPSSVVVVLELLRFLCSSEA